MTAGRTGRTPDWLVERIALGELPPAELELAKAKLLEEPDGAERLAALARSDAEVLAALPPEAVSAEVARRAHLARARGRARSGPRARPWLPVVLGVPLAAALAFFVVTTLPEDPSNGVAPLVVESTRLKGQAPQLQLHRRQGERTVPLAAGEAARPGELLQLAYQRAGRAYGVIVSIDGSGAVTRHLPETGERSAELSGSGLTALEHAYELDAAPGFERFFFLTWDEPFDLAPVLDAARALAQDPKAARSQPLNLPRRLEETSLLVEKVSP